MPSIDETNKAIYTLLHGNAPLLALATGDVHDTNPDDTADLPNVVFQRITGIPDYTLGLTLSSEKQVYMLKANAQDTDTKTGRELAAQIVDICKTLLLNASLSIAGSVTLACIPTHDLPSMREEAAAERSIDTFTEGFYFDVFAA